MAQDDDIEDVLKHCRGANFRDLQATAIIELLRCTGMRRSEVANLHLADVELDGQPRVHIRASKNGRARYTPISPKARRALIRFIDPSGGRDQTGWTNKKGRKRSQQGRKGHQHAYLPNLFLSHTGPMRPDFITQMFGRLSREAGVELTAHQFRRGLAHKWVQSGGQDDSLMVIAGWTDPRMPARYRAEVAAEHAFEHHRRIFGEPVAMPAIAKRPSTLADL